MLACLAGLPAAAFATDAAAAPGGVLTGDCNVVASGQLRSNDYIASYQGGCEAGQAHGQGRAEWRLRYAPNATPVVWQGRFERGVFLAELAVVGARVIDRTRVLLDLGPLRSGAQTGRLSAEARVDGKLPAQACQPVSLQVSAEGPLADDAVAKGWLQAAYQRWQAVCRDAGAQLAPGRHLRVQLHAGNTWAPDGYGNLPAGVVQAVTPMAAADAAPVWNQYTNRAAQQQANAQRQQEGDAAMRANQDRVREFARTAGATQVVELRALEQNPFRFGDGVLLVGLQLVEARTLTEAVVRASSRASGDWSRALLQGAIAQWDNQGRIAAVRVKGRSTDKRTQDALVLELVDSRRCQSLDCEDYLLMPGRRWLREGAP
jgi:hypothetical protein